MNRDLPLPAATRRRRADPWVRRYRFLTYVMGGGVRFRDHEKPADPVTPVRAAALRGHLRFWWRACNPSGCTTVTEQLHRREAEVWGAMSQPSPVVVEIEEQPARGRPLQVYHYTDRGRTAVLTGMREIAYGAFPLQPSSEAQRRREPPGYLTDYAESELALRLSFPPSLEADVAAALWAWETFGGLGGRVRRGFGAVGRVTPPAESIAAVRAALDGYRQMPRIAGVPSLAGNRFAIGKESTPSSLAAWKAALGALQRVRQGVDRGRNPPARSEVPAGRSRWPEPDEIRRLTGKAAPVHQKPLVAVQRFPRAVFGMPIVFHFPPPGRDDPPERRGDPDMKPLELRPASFERFASPLVLRPLPDGRGFRAAALVLSSGVPDSVLVSGDRTHPVRWDLDAAAAAQIPALRERPGDAASKVHTDPLDLLLWELAK